MKGNPNGAPVPFSIPCCLARITHERLLQRPILSPGGAFLVRSPRRTASTPASSSLARSPGGLRSQPLRDGIHELSGLGVCPSHAILLRQTICRHLRRSRPETVPAAPSSRRRAQTWCDLFVAPCALNVFPVTAADPIAWRGFSRSVSSTDRKSACVALTCEKPRQASVSAASRRYS